MRSIVFILVALAAASPLNAAAQAGTTSNKIDVALNPGDSATIVVTAKPAAPVVAAPPPAVVPAPAHIVVTPPPKPVVVRKADPVKEQTNCLAFKDAKWDASKKVPASQVDTDERCDLSVPNTGKVLSIDRVSFCNDPKDPEVERHVYPAYLCEGWARDRRLSAAVYKLENAPLLPAVDLKPLEAKVASGELENARIDGEVKRLDVEAKRLAEETKRLDETLKAHAEKLARSPECAELAAKGPSLLGETDAAGVKTGLVTYEKCLADPKTDPIARVAITAAQVAQQQAREAVEIAKRAEDLAKRANIRFGFTLGFAGGREPVVQDGNLVLRGGSFSGGELAFALAKQGWRASGALGRLFEDGHQIQTDGKFKSVDFWSTTAVLRVAHLWQPSDEQPLLIGPSSFVRWTRSGGSAFSQIQPGTNSVAFGVGFGAEWLFSPNFYATIAADVVSYQYGGGTVKEKPVEGNGFAPQFYGGLGFRH